jgi:hypothetical protein
MPSGWMSRGGKPRTLSILLSGISTLSEGYNTVFSNKLTIPRMILSSHVSDEKIFLFFSPFGNSIPNVVLLNGLWRMMFQTSRRTNVPVNWGTDATFVILKATGELFTGSSPTWGIQLAQMTLDILGLVRLECSIVRLMEHDVIGHDEHWDASGSGASAVVLLFRFCCTVLDRGVRSCKQLKKNYYIQKTTSSNSDILLEETM